MSTNSFSSLANIHLHLPARLSPNSCCPDKDLIVLFSRLGGTDRMSLWSSNQGSRIWEVDVGDGNCHAVDISWSPDGQSIAVMQDPPAISLHSLQDGQVILALSVDTNTAEGNAIHLDGMWWFREETKSLNSSNIPDIFKRNDIITGSSHSIFKLLPLLDNLQEDTEKLTATDLFAFQGSLTRKSHKTSLPEVITSWPTLSADLNLASISASSRNKPLSDSTNIDEIDKSNLNSVLLVTDSSGSLFSYLDGTFPLGSISLGAKTDFTSILKHPRQPFFVGSRRFMQDKISRTSLSPTIINFPLLAQRKSRDLAKLSSTSRELVWYILRVVKEMREVWYGSDSNTGAREFGPKWVQTLEAKQRKTLAEVNPILDLTCLLTTGRPSESLSDFLGSGEQMSERGIQKWESTVSEGLIKLRDSAEKRVAPALQRLHLVLDEILGWSKLQQFTPFELSAEEITKCLDLASNGILIANWLAATCRTEMSRFREFISWLQVNTANNTNDANVPRHDVLEVNNYFISGLASSAIDSWFIGPIPEFHPHDLGIMEYNHSSLNEVLNHAFRFAVDSSHMTWQTTVPRPDIDHLDRNIEALIQDLARRCERVFHHAAGATSRSAIVSFDPSLHAEAISEKMPLSEGSAKLPFRERATLNESQNGELLQHLIAQLPSNDNNSTSRGKKLVLVQLRCDVEAAGVPSDIGIALLECYLPEEEEERSNIELLDADFFDDECVVIVYRLHSREKQAFIATLNYNDIGYQKQLSDGYVKASTREDLMQHILELWKGGHMSTIKSPINRRRALAGCKNGGVSLALNGRVGRRVACVLDGAGTMLESFDLEGDAEDMEVTDDTRGG
ncbi:anaphase-promoting complex, cyclosome, subunit 4-domain-containing protein [Pholiota molesta]|nr:anaphase-promoting complex, cyclosome, subunit 4-domain-containing protein [Pholiota molesta]